MTEKRIFSIFMAFVLMLSMVAPAFADPVVGEIYGGGLIATVTRTDAELSVRVPTGGNLNFTIDPFGLLNMESDDFTSDLVPVTNEVSFDGNTILGVVSTSVMEVQLDVALSVTSGVATAAAPVGVTAVQTVEYLQTTDDCTGTRILLWVQPSVDFLDATQDDTTDWTTDDFNGHAQVVAGVAYTGAATVRYVLPALESQWRITALDTVAGTVTVAEELADTDDFVGVLVSFGGVFNENGSWGAGQEVGINVVFTATALGEGLLEDITLCTVVDGLVRVMPTFTAPTFIDLPAGGVGGGVTVSLSSPWVQVSDSLISPSGLLVWSGGTTFTATQILAGGGELWVDVTPLGTGTHTIGFWTPQQEGELTVVITA